MNFTPETKMTAGNNKLRSDRQVIGIKILELAIVGV
jgi:hypothetical protein